MSQKRPRERTVEVDGIGAVTVRGWPLAEHRRDTALVDEKYLAAKTGADVIAHAQTALTIASATVRPRLSRADVERLPVADRGRLLTAVWEAHPETRRALREVERALS